MMPQGVGTFSTIGQPILRTFIFGSFFDQNGIHPKSRTRAPRGEKRIFRKYTPNSRYRPSMRRFTASIHCVDSGPRDSEISYAFAYVFAASAASAAKCFHTEVWARGPNPPGPWAPLCGSILLLKQQKHKQMPMKSLSVSATCPISRISPYVDIRAPFLSTR